MRILLAACLVLLGVSLVQAGDSVFSGTLLKQKMQRAASPTRMTAPAKIEQKQILVTPTISRKFVPLHRIKPGKPAKPEGPVISPSLDLSDSITNFDLLEDLSQACGWNPYMIFQDKAAGHVFYYLPREFLLLRGEEGYGLSVQYNSRAEAGQPSVMLTAELQTDGRSGDVQLLKAIVREALGLKVNDPLELKSLKGIGATADMQSLATGLALSADRIHLTAPADFKQSFRLTLSLTQDEVEEVLAQVAREGVAGTLHVKVGEDSVPVPIRIRYAHFAGKRLDGIGQWVKNKPSGTITNITDFPLQLESINGYRMKNGHLERVSKQLKQTKAIAPGGSKSFKLPAVRKVLGSDVLVAWAGTSIDAGCTACLQKIDQQVRKGIALAQGSSIKLEAIPSVFGEFGIYKLVIRVQSPFFVSGGTTPTEREISLTEDANQNEDLQLFIPAKRASGSLLFRYQLLAVLESGESLQEAVWHDARQLSQFVGSAQLESLFAQSEEAVVE